MRTIIAALVTLLGCGVAAAQDPAPAPAPVPPSAIHLARGERQFSLELESAIGSELPWINDAELLRMSEREAREELWNAPLGRLYYAAAAQQAMLGREGLVNGGRSVGAGLTTTVLGDARHRGIQLLLGGEPWGGLKPKQRVRVGFDITSAIALALNAGG